MARVDGYVEGVEFGSCNCDYGCPCQFESRRPTHGHCRGFEVMRIARGHFGLIPLVGLRAALIYAWAGPIYEGNGERCRSHTRHPAVNRPPDSRPATGAEHRARIEISNGIEFEIAEIGSATTTCRASVRLDLNDSYGQFNIVFTG